jgi:creatinine amidohydrolase
MAEGPIHSWASLTSEEVVAFAASDPVVVLPLGAIEQHGPHLPLSTDLDIGMGILAAAFAHLPPEFPARALPPQALGASTEHARFTGTLALGDGQLVDVIVAQGAALSRAGVRRLVLSNSHGGNRAAMDRAGLLLRRQHGMLVVKATYTRLGRPEGVELPESEWRHGLHGGALETAMMLHLRPDRVREDRVADFPSLGLELERRLRRVMPEGQAPFSWLAGDLHPTGAVGDARLATAAMGEVLVEHYGRALAEVIQDTRAFPLERLAEVEGPP